MSFVRIFFINYIYNLIIEYLVYVNFGRKSSVSNRQNRVADQRKVECFCAFETRKSNDRKIERSDGLQRVDVAKHDRFLTSKTRQVVNFFNRNRGVLRTPAIRPALRRIRAWRRKLPTATASRHAAVDSIQRSQLDRGRG